MMKKITEAKAKRLTTPGLYRVDVSLYLRVWPSGSKSFVQILRVHGKRREFGLGGWPQVSFREARETAIQNRAAARRGDDPRSTRAIMVEKSKPTFSEVNDAAYKAKLATWKGGAMSSVAIGWRSLMKNYVIDKVGAKPIDTISRDDVLMILSPLIQDKPAAGAELTTRMEAVFSHAVASGHVCENVVAAVKPALPKRTAKQNYDALDWRDVPAALESIREVESIALATVLCVEWLILTACRSGEARGARWAEIDMEARTWTIPAGRMKAGQEHTIPLSDAMLDVLDRAAAIRECDMIFPSTRGGTIAAHTLSRTLKAGNVGGTIHGMRSAFRSWAADRGAAREVAEMCLAHTTGNSVELAYQRSDYLERRRPLMAAWCDFCTGQRGKVVELAATG